MDKMALGLGAIAALLIIRRARQAVAAAPPATDYAPAATDDDQGEWRTVGAADRSWSGSGRQATTGPPPITREERIRSLQTAIADYDASMARTLVITGIGRRLFEGQTRSQFIDGLWGGRTRRAINTIAADFTLARVSRLPHVPAPEEPTDEQLKDWIHAIVGRTSAQFRDIYIDAHNVAAGRPSTLPQRPAPYADTRDQEPSFWDQFGRG